MTVATIYMYDATGANEPKLPVNQLVAGYDTGWGGVPWTQAQFDRHTLPFPAIHIDQDPNASDVLADVLDVEQYAATNSEVVGWINRARKAYYDKARKGQRWPAIYTSFSNVTSVVGLLQNANIGDVPFWVADYNITSDEAKRRVATALGSYPAIGYQYSNNQLGGIADGSWMSVDWVTSTNDKEVDSVIIPNVPGEWLTVQEFVAADADYVVGLGLTNVMYYTKRVKGQANWTAPARI